MTDPTKVRSYVADVADFSQWLLDNPNVFKTYIEGLVGSGVGENETVTVVSAGSQTIFDTSPVRTDLMLVFIGSAYQPESTYTIDTINQITFDSPVPDGLNVHFVERKLAGTTQIPGGIGGQVLTKIDGVDGNYNWQTPSGGGGGSNNPGTTLALAHATISGGVLTENFDLFSNLVVTRVSSGSYTVTFVALTFPTADSYVANITADYGLSSNLRSIRIFGRSTTGFSFVVEDETNVNFDPEGLNILISGDPTLATTNLVAEPVGIVSWYAASTPPVGYLECNGAQVSRTTYAALFQIVGTVFGVGDGSTTFNLPDMRGRFVRGWNHAAADDNSHDENVGRTFGSYQADDNKAHQHFAVGGPTVYSTPLTAANTLANYSPITNTAIYALEGVATAADRGLTSSTGTESRGRNIALLPCIKAIPDFQSYAASQMYESFTVATASQSLFTTTTIDTRYCYVFVDGAYQPPSEYSTAVSSQVTFNTPVPRGSQVDLIKIYVATTAIASKANMIAALSNDVVVTPANIVDSPLSSKAWAKFSWQTFTSTILISDSRNIATITRASMGRYVVTWSTPFTSTHYVPMIAIMGGGVARVEAITAASTTFVCTGNLTNDPVDPTYVFVVAFGIQ